MRNRASERLQGDQIGGCYGYNRVTRFDAHNNSDMPRKRGVFICVCDDPIFLLDGWGRYSIQSDVSVSTVSLVCSVPLE